MSAKPILTTESGAPVADNQNSQTAGSGGPTLLQDQYLIEKLARFNRERIPERIVHAVATGAYGYLEETSAEVPKWTTMKIFERVGKKTDAIAASPRRTAAWTASGDAHRYRLGINHTLMPVNSPKGVPGGARNYGRDGAMPVHAPNGRVKNYEPNSFDGPVQTNQELYAGISVSGACGHYPQVPANDVIVLLAA